MPESSDLEENSKVSNQNTKDKSEKKRSTSLIFKIFKKLSKIFIKYTSAESDDIFENIKKNSARMSNSEKQILNNFLLFGGKVAEQVMIPRSDIISVSHTANLSDVNKIIHKYSHTRILVYEENLDNIIGFLHIKDLYNNLSKTKDLNLLRLIRKPIISTPSMKIIDLLNLMQKEKIHISVVIDEYGDTSGLVTRENILREIFGEINDEHEREHLYNNFKILNSNTIVANARFEVEDLEKILNVKLKTSEDDFETIGGLVMSKTGNLPVVGDIISISDDVEIEVLDASPRSVKEVKIRLKTTIINQTQEN